MVMQQVVGIGGPWRLGAVVLAPQPPAQPVSHPVLGFVERTRTLPVVEISAPAAQQLVQVIYCLGYAPMQCPVVQLVSHLLSQSLPAFGAGFNVRVPTPTLARALPAHTKAQEVEPLLAVYQMGFVFIEPEAPRLQPPSQPPQQVRSLSWSAQDNKVIRIAHQHRTS